MDLAFQYKVEESLSEKVILDKVKVFIEERFDLLDEMSKRIENWLVDYRNEVYGKTYASKDARLEVVEDNLEEIPSWLLYSVVLLGETNIQATATKLGLYLHEDNITAVKTGAELLAVCDGLGYEIVRPVLGSGQTFTIKPKIDLDFELKTMLSLSLFLPPMVSLPNAWTTKSDGGYELTRNYAILGDRFNKHEYPINLHALNVLQDVSYILDSSISKEDDTLDLSEVPSDVREQAEKNFELALKQNRLVYDMLQDRPFHFVWQYDKRGRMYSKGYHINIQGNEYRKAMLKFEKNEKLTDRGWYWLKVDIANAYGLDKETWDNRIKFVEDNIDAMLANPSVWEDKASDSLLFRSAVLAYAKALKTGETNHIVRLDATCSGPQLMSVAMRDIEAMKLLNVLGDETRHDYYTEVAKATYEATKDSKIWGDDPKWSDIRSQTKKATMTWYYNSETKPQEFFGKDTPELKAYYNVLQTLTKGAYELREKINSCWRDDVTENIWTLPDGHTAYCPVRHKKKSRIEVKEMKGGTAVFNFVSTVVQAGNEEKRSLAANIVHSIDGWICRQLAVMLAEQGIELSPIHDSFGVHPNYCDVLRQCYRGLLARLYRENLIDSILSEVVGADIVVDRPEVNLEIEQAIRTNTNGYYIC